ncbi:class I SAM-dependent methyltransferase [Acinetobacter junii]|uniref:class I SAM-dependent methyltransferase n=1 Tax=Acinetobacter junii TaxID=40215 RepID=UPI00125FB385|nr:class I SAM-dependent methyltransferase [Acinetobacter junii]MQZ57769.1 rRNA methyltransferase [Acinetobacter junii]
MRMICWYQAEYEQSFQQLQAHFAELDVKLEGHVVEKINSRFLRLNPDMALVLDEDGLSLSANGMKMQPDWCAEIPRLKRASLKSEMIARACQLGEKPTLIDATAGLGHDSLLMAHLGANVRLIERHPILFVLLEYAKVQAERDPFLQATMQRIQLIHADSNCYLNELAQKGEYLDVVYLDPMFPQRDQNQQAIKKQAQVKKQMQLLHMLLPEDGEMDLGDQLLDLAKKIAKRVIVKRPRHAVYLAEQHPDHQWLGDACRFDAYFPKG